MMKKAGYVWTTLLVTFLFTAGGYAQVESLQGTWNIEISSLEDATFSPVEVDAEGNVFFTETLYDSFEGEDYIFDIEHRGKISTNTGQEFIYLGVANGAARDTNETITVHLEAMASGVISPDNNMIVGVWYNRITIVTPEGQFTDEANFSFLLTREGYDPGTPGAALAGVWEITLTSENFEWTGEVTLDPEGTIMGEYSSSISEMIAPLAGIFSYSEDKTFDVSYTTSTILPVVGETTFVLEGEGEGNEDNTLITGTWTVTVQISNQLTRTFTGTFELKKVEQSGFSYWESL